MPPPSTPSYFFSVARGKRLLWSPAKLWKKGKGEKCWWASSIDAMWKATAYHNKPSNLYVASIKLLPLSLQDINTLLISLQEFFLLLLHTILQNICTMDKIVNIFIYCCFYLLLSFSISDSRVCDPIRLTVINQPQNAFHILSRDSLAEIYLAELKSIDFLTADVFSQYWTALFVNIECNIRYIAGLSCIWTSANNTR